MRWNWNGTNTASFRGIPASNKPVADNAIAIYQFKDGKVINAWIQSDKLCVLMQIGVIPPDLIPGHQQQKENIKNKVHLIDKFFVPANSKKEFIERATIIRNFIKKLPGFIGDAAYERTDEHGNLAYITIAVWENEDAVKKAKEAAQAEYKKQGFNPAEMFERLNITMDRGTYKETILQL